MIDDFNINDYLEDATIYSKKNPAKKAINEDDVYIPEDVLTGKRELNLYWDKDDPRNKEEIMIIKER